MAWLMRHDKSDVPAVEKPDLMSAIRKLDEWIETWPPIQQLLPPRLWSAMSERAARAVLVAVGLRRLGRLRVKEDKKNNSVPDPDLGDDINVILDDVGL